MAEPYRTKAAKPAIAARPVEKPIKGYSHAETLAVVEVAAEAAAEAAVNSPPGYDLAYATPTHDDGYVPVWVGTNSRQLGLGFPLGAAGADSILRRQDGDGRYQGLDATLTAFAGLTWTSGKQVAALTAADTLTLLTVGVASGANLLDRDGGDGRYLKLSDVDTDTSLAANSDSKVPSQKAVKAHVTSAIATYVAANDVLVFKGAVDCSTSPNYPAADAGHVFKVSVAGKIGGGSGPNVEVGDVLTCLVDSSAAGTHASVGANWIISQVNVDGAVTGPSSTTDGYFARANGTSGRLVKFDDAATVKTALSLNNVENKSSATIRGELTSGNVTGALTYTPTSVTGLTGVQSAAAFKTGLSLAKADVGLGNVDNVAVLGKQALYVPAAAMVARTTNGAASGTVETTTNKVMLRSLDFDTSTVEYAQFQLAMPKKWNEGTVTFKAIWSHAATTTNFGVAFSLQGLALSDDDAADQAFGTAITVTDTGGTTNDIYHTAESAAVTIAGSPAAEDWVIFQVARQTANGSDTMAIDARLLGVVIYITTDAGTDA